MMESIQIRSDPYRPQLYGSVLGIARGGLDEPKAVEANVGESRAFLRLPEDRP